MSKLSAALVGLVGCAVGLFLGLLVAALAGGSPPTERSAAAAPAVEAGDTPDTPSPMAAADWGALRELPEMFGPGTPAFNLIDYLTRHGSWVPNEKTGGPPLATFAGIGAAGEIRNGRAYLELTQIGDGKLRIEAVVSPYQWPDPRLEVLMQYGMDAATADPDLALAHRGRVFQLLTEAMGMPEEAREAAQRIERAVPLCWTSQQQVDGMARFCQPLPDEVLKQVQHKLRRSAEIRATWETPRVGFLLSDRWLMEVIFARAVSGHFHSGEVGFGCQSWSFLLGGPECGESGTGKVGWPRLTETETGEFLAKLKGTQRAR